jgi:heme/copper-type cytochrome/quinol oxidase subunit 1
VLGFLFVFVVGGVTGVMFAAVPFDQQITDSYFVVAHFHYVLFGGAVFPILGAIFFWVPKMFGRMMDERLGKLSFWLVFVGFNMTFFPMHISGLLGMPRRIYTYSGGLGWTGYNVLSSIGSYVLGLGIMVIVAAFVLAFRRGRPAGPDPWKGESLEWATSSPPPDYNFPQIPVVRSREPMWDQPELHRLSDRVHDPSLVLDEGHQTIGTTAVDADPESVLEMPAGSYTPVASAFGLALFTAGALVRVVPLMVLGAAIVTLGLLAWFRPAPEEMEAAT